VEPFQRQILEALIAANQAKFAAEFQDEPLPGEQVTFTARSGDAVAVTTVDLIEFLREAASGLGGVTGALTYAMRTPQPTAESTPPVDAQLLKAAALVVAILGGAEVVQEAYDDLVPRVGEAGAWELLILLALTCLIIVQSKR
jgi:hypothetical protein